VECRGGGLSEGESDRFEGKTAGRGRLGCRTAIRHVVCMSKGSRTQSHLEYAQLTRSQIAKQYGMNERITTDKKR
jgi:hypothetical protein